MLLLAVKYAELESGMETNELHGLDWIVVSGSAPFSGTLFKKLFKRYGLLRLNGVGEGGFSLKGNGCLSRAQFSILL
ncbi:hypothetical protein EBME_1309 [bacterium endosymbiont of Mortierella elongata FMR23-6]|nr:hypothetical protein EBME_1309 [bacterium endosymbiont of Mortierella elongata FMR23-6]